MRTSMLALAASLLMAAPAWAGESGCDPACGSVETSGSPNCCAHCGRNSGCDKYCKVVPYTKEVKKTVWVVKCEDYCPSLPGSPFGDRCGCGDSNGCGTCNPNGCAVESTCAACGDKGCDGCCKKDPCAIELSKKQTPPKCGRVHTKKVLTKKEIVCKVPSYKCVVVYGCGSCGEGGVPASMPNNVEPKPAAPAPSPSKGLPPPPKVTGMTPRLPDLSTF